MKRILAVCLAVLCMNVPTMAKEKKITFRVIETSDVHGCFFPYDFINRKPKAGTLARVSTYVNRLREQFGDRVILLDNGDILQGQPTCYYYNYVNTDEPNIAAQIINYMKYDAETFGNHDVETGHAVYDRWVKDVNCPMLGANIVDVKTGKPYVKPYTIIEREGVRIAILGMLTPAIPSWLQPELWSGLQFDEMVSSCRYWVDYIQKQEKADVIIGLFHAGRDGGIKTDAYEEDPSERVAREVPGFDIVMFGHDHTRYEGWVKNVEGKDVLLLDPSCHALYVSDATIEITKKGKKIVSKTISGTNVDVSKMPLDEQYMAHFEKAIADVNGFINRKIGSFAETITTRDCFFGPSAFTDFVHQLQLQITGAEISFNAPLQFNASINKGDVYVSDMFNLYKFENKIYVMKMTGEEVRKHLEMSYDLWVNTMQSPVDHIMLLNDRSKGDQQRQGFKNMTFNFDSAAGIDYEVDVTKPDGQKVRILRMSNGQPFDEHKWYHVVMNSYRGNGGGELLTRGAGIPHDQLRQRLVFESDRDLRHYLMLEIEKAGIVKPKAGNNWRFVPETWTEPALKRDRALIFGEGK